MKKLFLAFILAILTASPLLSQSTNFGSELHDPARIERFFPFSEGSRRESRLFDHISTTLDQAGISTERMDFSEESDMHSFSEVVRARIPGTGSGTLAIAVPVSHPVRATVSESGVPGIVAALTALRSLSDDPPEVSLEILFLGAERGDTYPYPMGSRRLLETLDIELPDALVYVDIPGAGGWSADSTDGSLIAIPGAAGHVAPEWLAAATRDAARDSELNARIDDRATQLFRIGAQPAGRTYLIEPWLESGVPSVLLVDDESRFRSRRDGFDEPFEPPRNTSREDREAAAAALTATFVNIARSFPDGIPDVWDRHTIAFQPGDSRIVLREQQYLIAWLTIVGITMLYGISFRRRLARYIRTVKRNLWTLLLLYGAAFAFLGAAGAIATSILSLRSIPDLWQFAPLTTFLFKLALAGALFQGTYLLAGRLPLSSNGSFYTASALLFVFLSVVVFAFFNITLSVYFLATFLIVFFFSISRGRVLKLFWLFLSVIPLLMPAVILFSLRTGSVLVLLITDWRGNLILAASILPAMLLFIRVGFLFSHPKKGRSAFVVKLVTFTLSLVTLALAGRLLLFDPFGEDHPQTVRVSDIRNAQTAEREVRLESNGVLPALRAPGFSYDAEASLNGTVIDDVPGREPLVRPVESEREQFLGRTRYRLRIDTDRPLRSIHIELVAKEPVLMYSANFPFSAIEDGRRQIVHIGRNPPSPLYLEIVVPNSAELALEYEAELAAVPPELVDNERHVSVYPRILEGGRVPISSQQTEPEDRAASNITAFFQRSR
ncbi:MAG: hypothetical protein ACOCRN_01425 [Spirochaetia bacterium]